MAFDLLYRGHHRFVWRSLRRLGMPADGLEDAVQDVFIVAARRLAEFEGRSTVRTWLFAIAVGVVRNERRARGRRRRRLDALASFQNALVPLRPAAQERVELLDLLDGLDAQQRAIVLLMEHQGFSGQEVSDALGLSMHGVYRRHKSARQALAARYDA